MRSQPLLEEKREKRCSFFSCTSRIFGLLKNKTEEASLKHQQWKNTSFEFLGAVYAMSSISTSVANIISYNTSTEVPWYAFTPFEGISWGGCVLALYPAVKFAMADARANTASSIQIARASDMVFERARGEEVKAQGEELIPVTISGIQEPLRITSNDWLTASYDYYNAILKTGAEGAMYLNTGLKVLETTGAIPESFEDEWNGWVRPTINLVSTIGFFYVGYHASAQALRNTLISFDADHKDKKDGGVSRKHSLSASGNP